MALPTAPGAASGESLILIGALLGHSNPATTARYAHLSNDPLKAAADRIFNLLPTDLATDLRALWDEFESGATPESRFATAMDRLQPMLHNLATEGGSWQEHRITRRRVEERNRVIEQGAPELWAYARAMLDEAEGKGWLEP